MMFVRQTVFIAASAILANIAAAEQAGAPLRGGSYEIVYRLELPHLERYAIDKTATICLAEREESSPAMLPILSGNNPFARCRAENVRRNGADLTYDVVCEGRASAKARAVYTVAPGAFKGRVAMVMAAKNMTMTEVQVGRRVGGCDLASASRD